jgi:hypothetical protein
MRLLTLPVIALAALAAAVPTTAAAKAPLCEHKAGDTLYRASGVRVFQRVTQSKKDPDADVARIYACKLRSRKTTRIETFRNNLDLRFVIHGVHVGGGRWLVLDLTASTGVSEGRDLFEYDLTSGTRTFTYSTQDTEGPPVVVSSGGGIALLGAGGAVRAFDKAGRRVLEPIGASDLAAGGSPSIGRSTGRRSRRRSTGHRAASSRSRRRRRLVLQAAPHVPVEIRAERPM